MPYAAPFAAWYTKFKGSRTPPEDIGPKLRRAIDVYLPIINGCLVGDTTPESITYTITCAHGMLSNSITSFFEPQWRNCRHSNGQERLDDYESVDPEDNQKSAIHCFLKKLARYYTACHTIVSELVALRRFGNDICITIETVPISRTTSTPANENEHQTLDSFLKQHLCVDSKELVSKKLPALREEWSRAWGQAALTIHPEMQLVSFYVLNPQLSPLQGFIGLNKNSCWCCDFVLG